MKHQPLISIITVNFNGKKLTAELLNSIAEQSFRDFEVIIVDNASTENPAEYFNKNYPNAHFIRSEKNLGFAGGNNLAVKEARGQFLFFINNDAEITEGCLEKLVKLLKHKSEAGIVSPLLCYFNESKEIGKDLIQYAGMTPMNPMTARNKTIGEKELNEKQFNTPTETAYAHGAAMMVKREVIDNVGVMFEDFFLYYEELDWCERIRQAKFEIWLEPKAKVYHKESATVGAMSTLKTYYLNRNRIYFMRRNFGGLNFILFSLFLLFVTVPKNVLTFLLRGQSNHASVFLKAVWWNVKDIFTKSEPPIVDIKTIQ